MDTEGMKPHPIFEAFGLVNDEINKAFVRRHFEQQPSLLAELKAYAEETPDPVIDLGVYAGWDRAFAEMEEDDAKEQGWAFSLGFESATEYHAETDWCDREGLMVDWYEREDLRP